MTSKWIIYVIEVRGSGHCHEAGLTVLIYQFMGKHPHKIKPIVKYMQQLKMY